MHSRTDPANASGEDAFAIVEPATSLDINRARELFVEYAAWLNVDLCFQGFDTEVATLPGAYARPDGRLYLALTHGQAAGCIALRRFDATTGEVKRLWVRPPFRGRGLARELVQRVLDSAREVGYSRLVLDTLVGMTDAIALYRSVGVRDIEPYYDNPLPGPVYMALDL